MEQDQQFDYGNFDDKNIFYQVPDVDLFSFEMQEQRHKNQKMQEKLAQKTLEAYQLKKGSQNSEVNFFSGKLSKALQLISKIKNYELRENEHRRKQKETNQQLLNQLETFGDDIVDDDSQASPTINDKRDIVRKRQGSIKLRRVDTASFGSLSPTYKDPSATLLKGLEKFTMVDNLALETLPNEEKVQVLKTQIIREETALRKKTDDILQSEKALQLVLDNQCFFAQTQDKIAIQAKVQREKIALQSIKEVNELISTRKNLQIEAYRLTQIFKTKVNTLAQKQVEDIFIKSMQTNKFKASSTLHLAKTFLNDHKKD